MADPHVYKKIEITGTSTTTIEDAVQNAVAKASETIRRMRWFEIDEIRGSIEDGNLTYWQVTIKIGFLLED